MKRFLTILLSVLMIVNLLPVGVLAEGTEAPLQEYTVTFLVGGNVYHSEKVQENGTVQAPGEPSGEGAFLGWYLDGAKFDFATPILQNTQLTAQFEAPANNGLLGSRYDDDEYRVFYDTNGYFTAPVDNNTYEEDDKVTVKNGDASAHDESSKIFIGWTTDHNRTIIASENQYKRLLSSGTFYRGGDKYKMGERNVTFYAVFASKEIPGVGEDEPKPETFNVSFIAGDNGRLSGETVFEAIVAGTSWNTAVTVPSPVANRGYHFADGRESFPDTVTQSKTYTANFERDYGQNYFNFQDVGSVGVKVYYSVNGSSNLKQIVPGEKITFAQKDISSIMFFVAVEPGYTLNMQAGFDHSPNQNGEYDRLYRTTVLNGASYLAATSAAEQRGCSYEFHYSQFVPGTHELRTFKITAVKNPTVKYTMQYDANGGWGQMTDANSPYETSTIVTVLENQFSREGFEFIGWNTNKNGTGTWRQPGDTFPHRQHHAVCTVERRPAYSKLCDRRQRHSRVSPALAILLAEQLGTMQSQCRSLWLTMDITLLAGRRSSRALLPRAKLIRRPSLKRVLSLLRRMAQAPSMTARHIL